MSGTGCDVVFYHQWLDGHPLEFSMPPAVTSVHPATITRIAAAFVAKHAPAAAVHLITDDATRFGGGLEGVAIAERPVAFPGAVALDRAHAYRDFVAARVGGGGRPGALFIDTDALLLRDPAPLFDGAFDVALTYRRASVHMPPEGLDRWGLPTDGRISAINGGVMASRYTRAALAFHDATLERYAAIVAAGADFLAFGRNSFEIVGRPVGGALRIDDVRIWGGHQFALTSLLSDALFHGLREDTMVGGSRVLLLPDETWNFSPPPGRVALDMLEGRWVLHLKGTRKTLIGPVASWFGIA